MTVRVTTLSELPRSSEIQILALDWMDNDPPRDIVSFLRKARAGGAPFTDYFALLAVENGEVLSRVGVQRPVLTTSAGTERFCAIEAVTTRPDVIRGGLALRLLNAAHRRERAEGLRWSLLWTRRSWGAHRLYEQLGYRDIYTSPSALRPRPDRPGTRSRGSYSLRTAKARDARLLEAIHREGTTGRLGFVPRFPGWFRLRFRLEWRRPQDHHVLYRGDRPVGYFLASQTDEAVAVQEAVVRDRGELGPLLDAMERFARRRWLAIGRSTFVTDAAALLKDHGFLLLSSSHSTLMARRLTDGSRSDVAPLARMVSDPRFSCHSGDMF